MNMRPVMLSILRIVAASYLGTWAVVYLMQSRYVYYPDRMVGLTPEYFGLAFEDVSIRTADGETLAGWFIPAAPVRERGVTLLFSHGNAGNIMHRLDHVKMFHSMGLSVLLYDYRGYGDSTGTPDEAGTYQDARAAWDYLVGERGISGERIVLYGESLGGAVATWLATHVEAGALALESTFTSAPDMAARMFWFLPIRWGCRFRYDTLARLPSVRCPVFVAHSQDDEMIPFAMAEKNFAVANQPKVLLTMKGGHNDGGLLGSVEYQGAFEGFLSQSVGAERTAEVPQE